MKKVFLASSSILLFIASFSICFIFFDSTPSRAQSVPQTKFGIFYSLWHCPIVDRGQIYDNSEILAGRGAWGPIPEFHYWGRPQLDYYCLARSEQILQEHAILLRDAGIDFVFVDSTNHAYTDSRSDRPKEMIMDPFNKMLEVWSKIPGASKIVPWVPVTRDGNMVNWLLAKLNQYPNMQFFYQGKPLLLVADNPIIFPPDNTRLAQLASNYTIRKMWGLYSGSIPPNHWSFLQSCIPSHDFKQSQGTRTCNQLVARLNENIEQVSITSAYQETYMSYFPTAVPKFDGRTLRKQFETLFNNPGVPITTITGWNEWVAQRFCLNNQGQATHIGCTSENDHFPDGNKVFIDEYNQDYSRDIEPGVNPKGDYYYRLTKACIQLYKEGKKCDASNSANLCCRDYLPIHGYVDRMTCDNPDIAGWATDDRDHSKKLTIRVEAYPDGEPDNKITRIGSASNFRSDLIPFCPPDGKCAFSVTLGTLPPSFANKKLRIKVYGVASDGENQLQWDTSKSNLVGPCSNIVNLVAGWNEITWLAVSGKKASDTPPECPIVVSKENFWFKPYIKNFGGVNFKFEKDNTYYLKCSQETVWQL